MAGLLLPVVGLLALSIVAVVYLRREPPVRGRAVLLVLRTGAILTLLLLLLNLPLPGDEGEAAPGPSSRWVLIDDGPGLAVAEAGGRSLREQVVDRATREARGGARLALAGPEPEGADTLSLARTEPRPVTVDFGPSLRRLAESGADSILLLSPFRTSRAALDRALEDLPVPILLEQVGGAVRNAGVLELDLPRSVAAEDTVRGTVGIFGEGGDAVDSVTVEVREEERVVDRRRIPLPPAGVPVDLDLVLPPPSDTGAVRYAARVTLDDDRYPLDDERVTRVRVGPTEGGILLVSVRPDWEPRVLLPILEASLGVEGEGYLRLGDDDRWMALDGSETAGVISGTEFNERLGTAGLLVVHGVSEEAPAPEWLARAVAQHASVIHLPAGTPGLALAGMEASQPLDGEWTADPELPASPLVPYLSGLPLAELPPLEGPMNPGDVSGTVALHVRSSSFGEPVPALLLREEGVGRQAVALASGFWRWAHRTGMPREAYRGLWSGVASWVTAVDARGGPAIRPVEAVVVRGRPFEWIVPDADSASLSLRFSRVEGGEAGGVSSGEAAEPSGESVGQEVRDVVLGSGGRGVSDPLPPGRWRWEGVARPDASAEGAPDELRGEGEIEVEPWSGALATPPLDSVPERVEGAGRAGGWTPAPEERPLRTHPFPYLLVLALICSEWVLRRRLGLR